MAKYKEKLQQKHEVINFDENRNKRRFKKIRKTEVHLVPRNLSQEDYIAELQSETVKLVFATGPAGTGKTMLATMMAIKLLIDGKAEKIILTRPAITADEDLGFLPGDLNEKLMPWLKPIMDIFEEYYSPEEISEMISEGIIEIAPIGYLRGRTFKNAIIVADEVQNVNTKQMKMLTTRLGVNSRMFLCGDVNQTDIKTDNGLEDILQRLSQYATRSISVCHFGVRDVEREPVVKEILNLYGEE